MKHLTTLLIGAAMCSTIAAQDVIVRQSNGTSHFYYPTANTGTELQLVLDQTQDGDTVYLPGVTYSLGSPLFISQAIVLMGTGIDADSTGTTGQTVFTNDYVRVANTADGAQFHGLTMNGGLGFGVQSGSANTAVNGVLIKRCHISGIYFAYGAGTTYASLATNTIIEESISAHIKLNGAANTTIRNCIVQGNSTTQGLDGAPVNTVVTNSVFFQQPQDASNEGVQYRDNIFVRNASPLWAPTEQSSFENNLWVFPAGGNLDLSGVLSASGNQTTTQMNTVFIDNSTTPYTDFDWANDYHIVPGQYQTMGYNGGEVGIYGGDPLSAWKEGSLPFNPHWDLFDVPGATTVNGVLQGVHLRGTAQTH